MRERRRLYYRRDWQAFRRTQRQLEPSLELTENPEKQPQNRTNNALEQYFRCLARM
jgi:hypothetical protein